MVFSFDYTIVSSFNPLQAMVIELLLCWLMGMFIGLLMFVLNLAISRSAGVIAAAAFAVFPLFIKRNNFQLHYFSPASWTSLSVIDFTGTTSFPSPLYVFLGYTLLIAFLITLAMLFMRQRDIDILKAI